MYTVVMGRDDDNMMITPTITMTETTEAHMKQAIVAPLARFNQAQSGRREDYRRLAILISHPDIGEILHFMNGLAILYSAPSQTVRRDTAAAFDALSRAAA
jgi:hypothetical protein